jgi:hypothetical protein
MARAAAVAESRPPESRAIVVESVMLDIRFGILANQ